MHEANNLEYQAI